MTYLRSSVSLACTSAAWPWAVTLGKWCAMRPAGSMIAVDRITPTLVLPYKVFSPQAP